MYSYKVFYIKDGVINAFRASREHDLSAKESIFNTYMAKQRMSIEWGFGKGNLKVGLSLIGTYYFASALLTNCYACYNRLKTAISFECATLSVYEYFHLSEEGMQVMTMYIDEEK